VIPARVDLRDQTADLDLLFKMEIDVDAVFDGWARVYLLGEEIDKLRETGLRVTILAPEDVLGPADPSADKSVLEELAVPAEYHTYATLTADLQSIASSYPEITRLFSLGKSVQGRELWIMKITDLPDIEQDEVEALLIASMHGDEVVGKELCFNLIDYLVQNYGTEARITDLVDNTEIWIMPSMNPDGTELVQRYNANNYNLNRDFPDQFVDPVNTPDGRQAETKAVMDWATAHLPSLAANMHGGALVVNYPFDSNTTGTSVFSPAPDPDHEAFVSISRSYADNNPPMSLNNSHPAFDNGITNGADWYSINGGMQDWAYVWHGSFHVTLEVSEIKWPSAGELPGFWSDNLESMLAYLERAQEGLRGIVTNAETGAPLAATILLDSNPFPSRTDPDVGDFHRIVLPGTYTMEVAADGYTSSVLPVEIFAGPPTRYDVALQPLPTELQATSHRVLDGSGGDGNLDPGETADLALTVSNSGRAATGLTARLEPTGWYADVSRSLASYPDVANGASVESDSPHHEIQIDPDVPTGHKLGFVLQWEAEQASDVSEPFFLDVGAATCETAADEVPRSIIDHTTAWGQITMASDVAVSDVQVTVDITHTYVGDLTLTLISPSDTPVVLHGRGGGSSDDLVGTYGLDLTPVESLALLDGESSTGDWRLSVSDGASGDTGTFNSWSLTLCGRPPETSPPEMRFRELGRTQDGVLLGWWPYPGIESYRVYRSTDPSSAAAFIDATAFDDDTTDTQFTDISTDTAVYYLVTGVGSNGEGPKGHFGE
jgi:carboxypeptidase D